MAILLVVFAAPKKTSSSTKQFKLIWLVDGVVNALSQDTPDFDAAKTSLASVVLNSPRDDNEERLKNLYDVFLPYE